MKPLFAPSQMDLMEELKGTYNPWWTMDLTVNITVEKAALKILKFFPKISYKT